MVRPKKKLGQHFLIQDSIAERIANAVDDNGLLMLEIGPGEGKLTQFLLKRFTERLFVIEIDEESVEHLQQRFSELDGKVLFGDFLKTDLADRFDSYNLVGNFPYNISSQILFRMLQYRQSIPQLVGMFQREVADRVVAPPGSKTYGILSVLVQAFYDVRYLFTVLPGSFFPPPKVKSGVIKLVRNNRNQLNCDEELFFKVVKQAFNQRRKTLRNSLRSLLSDEIIQDETFNARPEQLSPDDFEAICQMIEKK
ncbi:MAG: 16S rRNA (adenine(1518)-N(6)/adenine(1519)-N(6))-dimethyltransferase RsmA [Salinivirgaceae bacterium]|jgi:16S rRNA (adenine1518-N6/adenine1519-N6)-dimethyltransferase|nr:16S rRNA (adenine(1518)-N(6)/adenine(1519)-N(6))-dimethyltransferase RsmA [Salinivirgaceae bacterium]